MVLFSATTGTPEFGGLTREVGQNSFEWFSEVLLKLKSPDK